MKVIEELVRKRNVVKELSFAQADNVKKYLSGKYVKFNKDKKSLFMYEDAEYKYWYSKMNDKYMFVELDKKY